MKGFPRELPGFFPKAVRGWYGRLDLGSLKIRLWLYFGLFSVILVVLLWVLQIAFLNYSYEDMKISETKSVAMQIEARIQRDGLSEDTRNFINSTCREYDMYIQIETQGGIPRFMPNVNTSSPNEPAVDAAGNAIEQLPTNEVPRSYYPTIYRMEIDSLKADLTKSGGENFSKQTLEPNTDQKTLEYTSFLTMPPPAEPVTAPGDVGVVAPDIIPPAPTPTAVDPLMLFIFSPLYPMGSTIHILMTQLVYVTIIALLLAVLLGFYLSRMITRPIVQISDRAEALGEGNFGIDFPEAHYSEIKRLAETLNFTSTALAETRNMQRDIIANVSHDLRTPLTMIRSYAEMIADFSGENPEKRNAHLQVIIGETDRLTMMISELLDISKLQSGENVIKYTDFSLKELIESTIASYSIAIEQEGFKLTFVSKGEGVIRADEMRIKQVLDNLISNALKYGASGKIVEIRMTEEADYVRCEVTDHGVGISKRDLKHIWERYYQSSAHHSRTDSTGLGLSIVKEILVLHDARFDVTSEPHKGTTFWFEIKTVVGGGPGEAP